MKRVLYVIDAYEGGGGEQFLLNLIRSGINRYDAFDEHICTLREPAFFKDVTDIKVISLSQQHGPDYGDTRSKVYRVISMSIKFFPKAFKLSYLIFKNKYDIVVAIGFPAYFVCAISSLLNRKTMFIYRVSYAKAQDVTYIEKKIFRLIIRRFKQIICISNYVKETLLNVFPEIESVCKVIYNGIIIDENCKNLNHETNSISNVEPIFINIGRFVDNKAQVDLIEIFYELLKRVPTSKLILLGDGPMKKYAMELVNKYNIQNSVVFTGFVKDIKPWLSKSKIYIHGSTSEGFGNSVVEAMSYGLPVVAYNAGSMPELIDNYINGILVEPGNKKLFVDAMETLIKEPYLYIEISRNARKKVFDEFSAERMRKEYDKIYIELLSKI